MVSCELLQKAGLLVTVAENGKEAVRLLNEQCFDGVLMDIQMPVMDGYEATRLIRSEARFKDLPIIAMTANALESDRKLCLERGMNDHIAKPFRPRELYKLLQHWFSSITEITANEEHQTAEAIPDSSLPSSLPGISVEIGLDCFNNNEKLYTEMLHYFLDNHSDAAPRIIKLLELGDQQSSIAIAHSMKSIAGSIGAEKLMLAALELEKAISVDEAAIELPLEAFSRESLLVVNGLKTAFNTKH